MRFLLNLFFIIFTPICTANTFNVEGSDLFMGVGAKSIATVGAVSAKIDDVYSIYWNPAGLADVTKKHISIARQLNGKLNTINFIGTAASHTFSSANGLRIAIAFAWIPRLAINAEGKFEKDEIENLFLEYALPEVPNDFDGYVHSKTREYRFGIGILPKKNSPWRVGATLGFIKCGTNSCGISANDPDNYQISSTDATALSMSIGLKYVISDRFHIALTAKDLNTRLNVKTSIKDKNGERSEDFTTSFPHDVTLGTFWKIANQFDLTVDYQSLWGEYGSQSIDFKLIRAGLEYSHNSFSFRAGSLIPIKVHTASTGNLKNNEHVPFLPSTGIGWQNPVFSIDWAIYPHPIMSYSQKSIVISSDLNFTIRY